MKLHLALALAVLGAAPTVLPANPIQSASAHARSDFHLDRGRIDRTLAGFVRDGRVAGASVLIWQRGHEVYYGTAGYADRENKAPIKRDTLFQVWSMTKPITGVGLMRLWEQGTFRLDDPLSLYLPEYAAVKVFAGKDAAGRPILKNPERPILVRDILRHTAGFAAWPSQDNYPEQLFTTVDPLNPANDLAKFSREMATIPLLYEPGAHWRYSTAVDVQARLIEVLSGQKFEDYMQAQVLRPLGMKDSAWTQPNDRLKRLAKAYNAFDNKPLSPKPEKDLELWNFSDRRLTRGGAGLSTTGADYMRFERMMLGHGSLNGVRILKPSTVRLMTTDQLDPAITDRWWLPTKGNGGFGIDLFVRTGQSKAKDDPRGTTGEFFWDGAWSTLFWVDPLKDMAVVFLVQKDPYDGSLHQDIRKAVYGPDYLGPKGD